MKTTLDCIILAAGTSNRMGEANKMLQSVRGIPILKRVLDEVAEVPFRQRIVITGFEQEQIRPLIDPAFFEMTPNKEFNAGMTSSIQTGINALLPGSCGVMILPGDLPFLQSGILNGLIDRYHAAGDLAIVAAMENGITKNPVIFSPFYFHDILNHHEKNGCKQIIERNKQNLIAVEVKNPYFFKDIDTPEDLKSLDETIDRNN